jgi:hypothetical protein
MQKKRFKVPKVSLQIIDDSDYARENLSMPRAVLAEERSLAPAFSAVSITRVVSFRPRTSRFVALPAAGVVRQRAPGAGVRGATRSCRNMTTSYFRRHWITHRSSPRMPVSRGRVLQWRWSR